MRIPEVFSFEDKRIRVRKFQGNHKCDPKFRYTDTVTLKRCVIGIGKKKWFKWTHYQSDIVVTPFLKMTKCLIGSSVF